MGNCCNTHSGCGCNHKHDHNHGHSHSHAHDGLKSKVVLIGTTILLLVGAALIEHFMNLATWQLLLIYLVPYLLIGHDTLKEAAEGIMKGDMFNEDFLMSVATIGALAIGFLPGSDNEFMEAVFVMLFFQIGELFEGYAEGRSRDSISHLMEIKPDIANVERNGNTMQVSPEDVAIGETIVVRTRREDTIGWQGDRRSIGSKHHCDNRREYATTDYRGQRGDIRMYQHIGSYQSADH